MEILNLVGLILIAATNVYIGVKVMNQNTHNQIEVDVAPAEICYASLAEAMEASWPAVTVSNDITIDYDKLAEAISKLPAPTVIVQTLPTVIPNTNPIPAQPSPYWQSPNTYTVTVNDVEVPVRSFPKRMVNGGDSQ